MKTSTSCLIVVPLLVALGGHACAQNKERLFASADPAAGKVMHAENNCTACHQLRTGKNDHAFYTAADRKVSTQEKLIAQIAACSVQLNLGIFPEEELNLAAYLNSEYYKLK